MIDSHVLKRIQKYIIAGVAVFILISISVLQQSINYSRVTEDLVEQLVIMPGEFVTNFIIGGFRGIAVDVLWIRMDEMWHSGKWFDVVPIIRIATWLQPHFLDAWELGAWHMAYNLYVYAEGMPDREKYIFQGIVFLKEGIAKNRNVYDLWFNLGWIYYNKLQYYDEGIRYFKSATRYKHPSYIDRLIAHAFRKKGDIESEYRQWQHCLTTFPDDEYHIGLTIKHLNRARDKLKEMGKLETIDKIQAQ